MFSGVLIEIKCDESDKCSVIQVHIVGQVHIEREGGGGEKWVGWGRERGGGGEREWWGRERGGGGRDRGGSRERGVGAREGWGGGERGVVGAREREGRERGGWWRERGVGVTLTRYAAGFKQISHAHLKRY